MEQNADLLITGTGAFAARILFDVAATADTPTRVAVAGRNEQRLAWLQTAAAARAHMFRRPVSITVERVDLTEPSQVGELLARTRPAALLQAASLQPGSVIAGRRNGWSDLVAEGGLSASAVFQTVLSARVARSCIDTLPGVHFVNACFPDVVNGLIAAMGLPVTSGIGNIQILAHAFGGSQPHGDEKKLALLAHYQNLAAWRQPPAQRAGANARVWIENAEIDDLFERFRTIQLTPEPVIDISGAAAAPYLLALAHRRDWSGHVPGPMGLPGGYPVRLRHGELTLDLPNGITRDAAVRWNAAHEEASGLVVDTHGHARFTGKLQSALARHSRDLAHGFYVRDIETVFVAMQQLRSRLLNSDA